MNANQLLEVIGDAHPEYLEAALKTREKRPARRTVHKLLMVAAIAALMVMLLGCAVAVLSLADLKMGEYKHTWRRYDKESDTIVTTEIVRDVISLQGVSGTPEFLAAQEWNEYEQDFRDNRLDEADDDFPVPEEYDAYFIYNQEMLDKVKEVCDKYGLKTLGPIAGIQRHEQDIFFEALGISRLTKENAEAAIENGSGYFYANGNFKLEFWFTLTGEEVRWPHDVLISYSYKEKGYLDSVTISVADIETVKQWNYTVADGTDILIIRSDERAILLCDRKDAFLSADFDITREDENGVVTTMTDRDIELVAEVLDFTVKPKDPDMAEVRARLEASYQKELAEKEAYMETWVNPFDRDYGDYSDVIAYMLENAEKPENIYYGLMDMNGDGEAELLIGNAHSFGSIKTVVDGEVVTLLSNGTDGGYILCNDRVFMTRNGNDTYFYRIDTLEYEKTDYCIDRIVYDSEDGSYTRTRNGVAESVTEEAAAAVLVEYGRHPSVMKPITEFPMEE